MMFETLRKLNSFVHKNRWSPNNDSFILLYRSWKELYRNSAPLSTFRLEYQILIGVAKDAAGLTPQSWFLINYHPPLRMVCYLAFETLIILSSFVLKDMPLDGALLKLISSFPGFILPVLTFAHKM